MMNFIFKRCFPYVLVWTGIGVLSWHYLPTVPNWLTFPGSRIQGNRWGQLIGIYCFSVSGSTLFVNPILAGVRKLFGLAAPTDITPTNLWPPVLVGSCEAILYPTAMLIGKPEFIGVWLALKVAGQWKLWASDSAEKNHYAGRNRFNMFLIGNALSIINSFVFARIIRAVVIG